MQQNISPEHYFYLHKDGILKNYEDLFSALQDMDEHVFRHHVNEHKNDFALWAKDVFEDVGFARKLERTKDQSQTLRIVFTRLFL
ncbi:hypothetical protein CMO92_00110 [Candidatus Woesearchaeota archaeon]|nr:hypothetical protein [Candidatus Woesearchaeota archaeon]|tara:strand:- start:253 stop:507 length:255 start_codon:yes stop_codon:yes gene_type:complete